MRNVIQIFLIQFILFNYKYSFIRGNALIGKKVKDMSEIEFSSVACLYDYENIGENLFCSATYVSYVHVVTSASCLLKTGRVGLVIKSGSHDIRLGEKFYPLWWMTYDQYVERHQKHAEHSINDIAMIRLTEPNYYITPAKLSQVRYHNLVGRKATILGCALGVGIMASMTKKKASVEILEYNVCDMRVQKVKGKEFHVPYYFLCTVKQPYVLLEEVDYGGPLLYNDELIGINLGVAPDLPNLADKCKVNLHINTLDYITFIEYYLNRH